MHSNCQFAALMQRLMHDLADQSSYPGPTVIASSSRSSGIERTDYRASALAGPIWWGLFGAESVSHAMHKRGALKYIYFKIISAC
jgi:hypothetical protein